MAPMEQKPATQSFEEVELLNPNTGTWDKQLEDTFWPKDAAIIFNTPTYENVADTTIEYVYIIG
jgi:hypothetical protein